MLIRINSHRARAKVEQLIKFEQLNSITLGIFYEINDCDFNVIEKIKGVKKARQINKDHLLKCWN